MAPKQFSAFWSMLILLVAIMGLTVDQTLKLHAMKDRAIIDASHEREYEAQLQQQLKWVEPLRKDLIAMAPSHPEAARIVTQLNLDPPALEATSADKKPGAEAAPAAPLPAGFPTLPK